MLRAIASPIFLVGGTARGEQVADIRPVPDRCPGTGALGGIYTALVEAPTDLVLVVACDMPFLTVPLLERLAALAAGSPDVQAVVPRDARRRHPLCGVYARTAAPALRACLEAGRLRVTEALAALRTRDLEPDELTALDPDGRLLVNINTPDDYTRAQTLS